MSSESVEVKGFYTRRELLHKIAGGERKASSIPSRDRVRRIWPDEPNVGFVEERMAFLVDGAVRIGGPTLKTYDLNGDGTASQTRETRLYYDDTYGKLRGSENALDAADVFNAVGAWSSEIDITAGSDMAWDTQAVADAATFAYSYNAAVPSSSITILRPGVYFIAWRAHGEAAAPGTLAVTLTVGSDTHFWDENGLPGSELFAHDTLIHVKTTTVADAVTLTLTTGDSLGGAGNLKSELMIVKLR